MTAVLVRNPITPEQRARLNRLSCCTFLPGSWDKRFVRNLSGSALECEAVNAVLAITPAQAEQIDRLHYRYRKQIAKQRKAPSR